MLNFLKKKPPSDPCILYDQIWSKDVLDYYREMCLDENWKGKQISPSLKKGDRQVYYVNEDYPDPDNIINAYRNYLSPAVSSQLSQMISDGYSVDCKLSRYGKHQNYGWHCDASHRHTTNPEWARICSSITYLNDDYEGGHTEFEKLIIKPESGKTVVFPSAFIYPHRGNPVITGVKHILVMHFWA